MSIDPELAGGPQDAVGGPQQTIAGLRLASDGALRPDVRDYQVELTELGGVPIERVSADGVPSEAPTILYFHGGAYMCGHPAGFRNATVWLSRIAGAQIVVPDYRLAPEHPFPAAYEDALTVYRALLQEDGVDPGSLAVVGDSAGGAIAVSLVADAIAAGLPEPSCVIANSPYAAMSAASPSLDDPRRNEGHQKKSTIEWLTSTYLAANNADPRDPRHSPVYRDLSGLPSLLVQVGGLDNLHDDGVRLAAQARSCGVDMTFTDYVFSGHIWIVYNAADRDRWARVALEEMRDFIAARAPSMAGSGIDSR